MSDQRRREIAAATDTGGVEPQIECVEQVAVPFLDEILLAVLATDGEIYVPIAPFAQHLGMANPSRQVDRVRRDDTMSACMRPIPLETAGGIQRLQCLRVDMLLLWLATVREKMVKESIRPNLSRYKQEAAKAILDHFRALVRDYHPMITPETSAEVAIITEQIDTLTGVVNLLREHLVGLTTLPGKVDSLSEQMGQALTIIEALAGRQDAQGEQIAQIDERTQRLTPTHTRTVQEFVERMVHDTKRLPIPLSHYVIYGRLKHHFRAGSYKEIADDRFEDVMAFLKEELRRTLGGATPEQGALF